MTLPADYHMHTPLCHHAVGEPSEYAEQAAKLGLDEIGFSDHNPMPRDDFDEWRMALSDLDVYVAKVRKAQRDFPALRIKLALEVDYFPEREDWVRELAARHPWDYLIGSVHYISDAWDIDNPKKLSRWSERDPMEVWSAYFDRLTQAAASGLFEIIGHADLCKKFCYFPKEDCGPLFERFLQAARKGGAAIEINTAGLRKDCKEMYPSFQIVRRAAALGVPLTFGSDAHAPGEVGMAFSKAVEVAKEAGYTHALRFTQRRAEPVRL